MNKLTLLIGVGIGYVLGARAGRDRYESIKETANTVAHHPKVQQVVDDVQTQAAATAQQAAAAVKEKVTEVTSSGDDDPVDPVVPPGATS